MERWHLPGATETMRIVCKETLQSLVTTFTNMELNIRVKRFTRMTEAIADYVGKEYSKEMKLLVENQKEIEPKELVMPGKKETKLPSVMKNDGLTLLEARSMIPQVCVGRA
jgi:hypothetical protein